jgi:hypothetical protein
LNEEEDILNRLTRNTNTSTGTSGTGTDLLSKAVTEALTNNPHVVNGLKKYFSRQIVLTGAAMAMFDMGTVSLGLSLVDYFKSPFGWIPISFLLYAGTAFVLKQLVS